MQSYSDYQSVRPGNVTASLIHEEALQRLLSCHHEVEQGDECLQESQQWFALGHEVGRHILA